MALSASEVLMIIRAKDLASREIAQIGAAFNALRGEAHAHAVESIQQGQALLTVGAAMGIAGAAALTFYGSSLKAAIEYNKEVAYTATQIENGGEKLKEIGQIGVDVAKEIPAPFKELQASLYDIFSSTNANLEQAEILLAAFAKGAVAGMTDIQTAGRATISIMNAFKIPFEDVNHVMDVQFETVRLGVITYEQLATTIGRAIPSAVRAGQSIEDLAGMIAFLTRNGLSAAMAATSAARALDLLSNPKFASSMEAFGISVTNAEGAFRPMVDVVDDLKKKFGDLAPAQRTLEFLRLGGEDSAEALRELGINAHTATGELRPFDEVSKELTKTFKGMSESEVSETLAKLTKGAGGTIQAMRFLNLAVGDSNGLLRQLTEAIEGSAGAADKAYQIMRATPAMQVQLLSNQWQILKKEIGDGLIPAFTDLIGVLNDVLRWWLELDVGTKNLIAKIGLFIAAITTLAGILTAIAGAVLLLHGMFVLLSGSILPIIATVAGFVALSTAIVYLATQTQFFQKVLESVTNYVKTYVIPAFNLIKDAFERGGWIAALKEAGALLKNIFLPQIQEALTSARDYIIRHLPEWAEAFRNGIVDIGGRIKDYLLEHWRGALQVALIALEILIDGWFVGILVVLFVKYFDEIVALARDFGGRLVDAASRWGPALWQWIQDALPDALSALNEYAQSVFDWITDQTPGFIRQLGEWGMAFALWVYESTPDVIAGLEELLVSILNWIRDNIQGVEDELAQWAVKLVEWIIAAIPLALIKLQELQEAVVSYIANVLIPAVAELLGNVGIAAAEAFARGLVGIPLAIGRAILEPLTNALTQQSEFVNQTSLNMGSFNRILHQTGADAEVDLDIIRQGGQYVIATFSEIAAKAPETATQIIAALQRAGIDTKIYEQILRDVQASHNKIGDTAEDGMRRAQAAANMYRSDLNLLLGSITGVQSATAQFDLAVAALSRQVESNSTSTASNTEKQALLQGQFDRVFQSALGVIAKVKEHGIATDEDKAAVERAILAMEDMKSKNPGQAAALQLVIDKLRELADTPEVHKNNTIETTYTTNNVTNEVTRYSSEGERNVGGDATSGPGQFMGGIVGWAVRALAQGGTLASAAMGAIKGFKTSGPTLVGEGNPNYPEFVIATDPTYRDRNLKLFAAAGHHLGLYAKGGMLGKNVDITDYLDNLAQLQAIEWLVGHIPTQKAPQSTSSGLGASPGGSALQEAARAVRAALPPGFAGVPGSVPSLDMIMGSLGHATSLVDRATTNPQSFAAPTPPQGFHGSEPTTLVIENINITESQDARATGNEVARQLQELLDQLRVRR